MLASGDYVVDLGCSPGSWLQYAAKVVGQKGAVLGYDLVPPRVELGPSVAIFEADVHTITPQRLLSDLRAIVPALDPALTQPFHVLLSDMAPKTIGVRDADQARSIGLVEVALYLATQVVKPGGHFVAKTFEGRGVDALVLLVKKEFRSVKVQKPKATREGSREMFVVGRERR